MDVSLLFQYFLALVVVEASGISEGLDKEKCPKPILQRFHVRGLEGVIKGGVVGLWGGFRDMRLAKKKGRGKKGVRMEMLLLQRSVKPELYIGKTAHCSLCSVQNPLCSAAGHSWYLLLRIGSLPQCSLHSAQWLYRKMIPSGTVSGF